jgi:hypothetical protein
MQRQRAHARMLGRMALRLGRHAAFAVSCAAKRRQQGASAGSDAARATKHPACHRMSNDDEHARRTAVTALGDVAAQLPRVERLIGIPGSISTSGELHRAERQRRRQRTKARWRGRCGRSERRVRHVRREEREVGGRLRSSVCVEEHRSGSGTQPCNRLRRRGREPACRSQPHPVPTDGVRAYLVVVHAGEEVTGGGGRQRPRGGRMLPAQPGR